MWSVSGAWNGSRLRYNARENGQWYPSDRESVLIDSVSKYPVLFASSKDLRYCTTYGRSLPLRFVVRNFGDKVDSVQGSQGTNALALDDVNDGVESMNDAADYADLLSRLTTPNSVLSVADAGSAPSDEAWTMRVWPQPARGVARVAVATNGFAGDVEMTLYNALGARLKSMHVPADFSGLRTCSIDVHGLPSGMYLLTLQGGGKFVSSRVAITR
jgi:hypothetical protein